MISKRELKSLVESQGTRPDKAALQLRHALGLCDQNGRDYKDRHGHQQLKLDEATMTPDEFSIRVLAEAFLGDEAVENICRNRPLYETAGSVMPSQFVNISGYTLAVGGLLEFKVLEAFNNPEFINDRLASLEPTSVLGEVKHIGMANVGDLAQARDPGELVKMVGLEDRWTKLPETVEHSLGLSITYEAVAQDLTGQILARASGIGHQIGIRKELRVLGTFLGATNSYHYKGQDYNTYQTASPWINDQINQLDDWTDINNALQLFSKMTDPETGLPIAVAPKDVLVMPAKYMTARKILRDTTVEARTPTTMAVVSGGNNPVAGMFDPITSPFARYVAKATAANGGLAFTDTKADGLWFMGDFKKAFGYREFHPLMVVPAVPNTYEMAARRITAAYFAYERGTPFVREPRYVVRNTYD